MSYEYKEETLIQQFTPWFTKTRNYSESFEDTDTSGSDPVDSAGFIGSQTVLIEFKHSLSPKEVRYEGSQGGSIEKKIRTVLNNLYHDKEDRVTKALKGWNRFQEPLFILVANKFSDSVLILLKQMFTELSIKWHFGYEIIKWENGSGTTLLYSSPQRVTENVFSSIEFPEMPSTAPARNGKMTLEECLAIMDSKNLKGLMDEMIAKVQELGGQKHGNPKNNINFSFPPVVPIAVIGFWPNHSDPENGLLVTFWIEGLQKRFGGQIDEDSLPGVTGPRKGHLGASRYFKTVSEIAEFWEKIIQ